MIRSIRTATHPDRRREGLARALVEHEHETWSPDLFGTLFGATSALLAFRRAQGYRLVRLGVSRGSRTGEPSAVMVRPCTSAARALVDDLRGVLARDLPLQLELMEGDGLALDPELRESLLRALPPPRPHTDASIRADVVAYTQGPRPFDAAASSIHRFVMNEGMNGLNDEARGLIGERVLQHRPWVDMARDRSTSVPAVMRALRRAVGALVALREEA
jgi:tRNA(Met) cytidine acetyltransferase